jgi:hypothetical protein
MVQAGQNVKEVGSVFTNFDTNRTLASGGRHGFQRERVSDAILQTQSFEACTGEHNARVLTFVQLAQPGVQVASQGFNVDVGPQSLKQDRSSQAGSSDHRALRQALQALKVGGYPCIPWIFSFENARIPNMSVACPADENECRQLLSTAYAQDHPVTVRYPRGSGIGAQVRTDLQALPFGRAEIGRQGRGLAILAFGPLLYEALKAAESLDATVVNMRWAKPLDLDMLEQVAQQHERFITIEDGVRMGGAGAAVLEALQDMGICKPVLVMGFEDTFTEHGDPQELMQHYGLTAAGIHQRMARAWPQFYVTPSLRKVV